MPASDTQPPVPRSHLTPFREGSRHWLTPALSHVDIYPMPSQRLMGGDATLEPGNESRGRD